MFEAMFIVFLFSGKENCAKFCFGI